MKKKFTHNGRGHAFPRPLAALAILAGAGLLNASAALAQEAPPATDQPKAEAKAKAKAGAIGKQGDSQTVIVTGTVGATEAKAANVSYSVLDAKDLGKFAPMSADDFLRDMPGVVVESNEGVARNESYTRGMSVGTGSPTTGNFWTAILEDGLPVLPVRFNNFQDSSFYRADIGTSRVESVRGGSAGTSVASSAGAVFNFLPGAIQPGAAIQTRLGVEGEDPHLSWKQVDGYFGWKNERGDLRASATGFYRTSTGATDPGYPLNLGGQVKLRVQKNYELGDASGTVALTVKHLDDTNSWNGQFTQPAHGYVDPVPAPGFLRSGNMFMHGGQHTVNTSLIDGPGASRYHDPEKGANYKQDAVWLKWDHETGGRWSFNSALKAQNSKALLRQGFYGAGPGSLWGTNIFQDAFTVNQGIAAKGTDTANLNRQPGYYELYDRGTGAVRARIYNNVGKSNGVNYRTGAACPAGSAASPAQCVAYTNLPNANFDMAGGLVNGIMVPSDSNTVNKDVVYVTNSNFATRESKDLMLNFLANYAGDNFRVQAGLFAVQARQGLVTYFNGRGISAFGNGEIANLGARFVTDKGSYQLTDEGGWGRVGGGNVDGLTPYIYSSRQRDIQPMLGGSWSPGKWDLNASYKGNLTMVKTHTIPFVTTPQANDANSRGYGGLDGNALTWYDNQNYVRGATVNASKKVYLKNYSGSVGYNITPEDKVYYRHSLAGNNIIGIVSRYQTQFNADNKPLFPQVDLRQDEVAYVFNKGALSGQLTAYRTEMLEWIQQTPLTVDGSTYVVEYLNHFLTKGLEGWLKWRVTPKLSWSTSGLYSQGRAVAVGSFAAGAPGPEDDKLTTVAGIMAKTPRWVVSNTVSYQMADFQFNLRHRFMAKRKRDNNPADRTYLPPQRNFDFSVAYAGIKNVRISLDVRNVLNNKYISAYDTMLPTVTGVSKNDIMQQLPESGAWNVMNPPRSYWLTARYDF
ncbi:TonB-dependent receptor [Pseudoduganella namucuonensis]|uniref:TonB-dependent Receptor Plug Domain n=1 Tax=Pseudoduganella namucuonensis TaxID=1035707 RepID=A0A1I7H6Z7_9BURK|nr:TonB-dependent receptor [Pseudoduganella namucuonensis]SFU56276.1 TonB-dependent Receptor Plug Domain [Pseudoduganella namucuonensis]